MADTFAVDSTNPDSVKRQAVWIVAHQSGGYVHYGAAVFPMEQTAELPVMLHCHWGDAGASIDADFRMILGLLGSGTRNFVHVIPSFRSELLSYGDSSWRSEGPASPWKEDVLDAIRLVAAVESLAVDSAKPIIAETPRKAIGFSRGGGVALLVGLRDSRYDRVVDYFGPTDFYGEYVKEIFKRILLGDTIPLPGVDVLDSSVIQQLNVGSLSIDSARFELLVRSPARFAADLPAITIHHGTEDSVVSISQSEFLWSEIQDKNGDQLPLSRFYSYPGVGHNPFGMFGNIDSTVQFLTGRPAALQSQTKPLARVPFRMPGFQ